MLPLRILRTDYHRREADWQGFPTPGMALLRGLLGGVPRERGGPEPIRAAAQSNPKIGVDTVMRLRVYIAHDKGKVQRHLGPPNHRSPKTSGSDREAVCLSYYRGAVLELPSALRGFPQGPGENEEINPHGAELEAAETRHQPLTTHS
jgi:hypothetical protein